MQVNGKTEIKVTNKVAAMFKDVKVYAGDPWYPAMDGKIRKLEIVTQNDEICICKAARCGRG